VAGVPIELRAELLGGVVGVDEQEGARLGLDIQNVGLSELVVGPAFPPLELVDRRLRSAIDGFSPWTRRT